MFESDDDRLALIQALGGQLVRHPDGEFWAILDSDYLEALGGSRAGIDASQLLLTARTSDTKELPKDAVLDIAGEQYRIKRHESDGTGMSRIVLRR